MKFLALLILSFAFSGFSQKVFAAGEAEGILMSEGLFGYSLNFSATAPGSTQSSTYLSSETRLGYVFNGWFYVGGVFNYTLNNEKILDSSSTMVTHALTYQYYGPSVGYIGESWIFLLSYYAAAEKRDTVTGSFTTQNYDNTGAGFGFNIGYKFVMGDFNIAPVIAYKNITYSNCKDPYSGATSSCNPSQNQAEFTPYLTLMYNFR